MPLLVYGIGVGVASFILRIGLILRPLSGVPFVVAVVFIILKAVGVLHWSWMWVLAPIWIQFAYFPFMIVSGFIMRHYHSRVQRRHIEPQDREIPH